MYARAPKRGAVYRSYRPLKRTRGTAARPIYVGSARPQKSVASQVRAVLNGRTGGFVGLEKKFFDSARAAIALTAPTDASGGEVDPATLDCLNCPAQGDGEQNRDGRVISMHNVTVKGIVSIAAKTAAAPDVLPAIFIALVMDKQTNSSTIDSERVFNNPSGNAVLAPQPFLNLENMQRFDILKTMRIDPKDFVGVNFGSDGAGNGDSTGAHVPFSLYHAFNGMKVTFITGQTSSVIAAIADKSVHVVAYCSSVEYTPTLQYNARLRFTG